MKFSEFYGIPYRIPNKRIIPILSLRVKRTKEEFYSRQLFRKQLSIRIPQNPLPNLERRINDLCTDRGTLVISKSYRLSFALIILIRSMTRNAKPIYYSSGLKNNYAQDIERNYNNNGTKHREVWNVDDVTREGVARRE